jgi:hypothetical protein
VIGVQPPPYDPDDYASSRNADKLLRPPRRSFAGPIIVFAAGVVLGAIGFGWLGRLKPHPQNEEPIPPKRPDRFEAAASKPLLAM